MGTGRRSLFQGRGIGPNIAEHGKHLITGKIEGVLTLRNGSQTQVLYTVVKHNERLTMASRLQERVL